MKFDAKNPFISFAMSIFFRTFASTSSKSKNLLDSSIFLSGSRLKWTT